VFRPYRWSGMSCPIFAALFVGLVGGCSSDAPAPLETVSDFDVPRYLGHWNQVAAIPAWFQSDCAAHTVANYALGEDGLVEVVNFCQTADGERKRAEARARFVNNGSDGRLEVTFVEVLGFWVWLAAGDYWIIGLDPDYQWSIVGQPSRKFAWILARSESLDRQTLKETEQILRKAAYDPCDLLLTTPEQHSRLCDVTR
jgi:apolipoprotein D and lipocalin family protein